MQKVIAIIVFVLLISSVFFGCKSKSDFANQPWKDLGEKDQGVQYVTEDIENTSMTSKGVGVEFFGSLDNGKLVTDSANDEMVKAFVMIFGDEMKELVRNKNFAVGTRGYLRLDVGKLLISEMENAVHFTIYLPSGLTEDALRADSAKLAATHFFKKIDVVSNQKAISKWNAENDTTWRKLLEANPLPNSIELILTKKYFDSNSIDSIKAVMSDMFPNVQIQSALRGTKNKPDSPPKILLYKFYVL